MLSNRAFQIFHGGKLDHVPTEQRNQVLGIYLPGGTTLVVATANAELGENTARLHPDVKPGRYALLSVTDTGTEMSEAVRTRVFEPFFTTKAIGQGTGLGLATVYGIVKQSGGHVEVTSKIGSGTTFRVYLPVVDEPLLPPNRQELRLSAKGDETVLLVEDEELVRKLTKLVLEQNGYTVLEASDGAEALRVAGTHSGPIHLLLTDLVMPGMSGREVAEQLAGVKRGMRVLFMSGYAEDIVIRKGVVSATTNLLHKPFTLTELTNTVRNLLDQP
ncbi:response regulator [Neorhodopirellula pilleata]|uniref:response regulator n=1 Tax=Neorhodopirellula pilleata TaxID=2714738 RepID=UPI001E616340|nr:response regulator [Neorhodopirellula pilleata]